MSDFPKTIKESRIARANLEKGKKYNRVVKVNGKEEETPVGYFVKSYTMGSGDGMTFHLEFNLDGKNITLDDEMWGSWTVSESDLAWFKEAN